MANNKRQKNQEKKFQTLKIIVISFRRTNDRTNDIVEKENIFNCYFKNVDIGIATRIPKIESTENGKR